VEEESYFFRLSTYQQKLLDLYEKQPDFVLPKERLTSCKLRRRGLRESVDFTHDVRLGGIKVPGNSKHIMYVWVARADELHYGCRFSGNGSGHVQALLAADLHVIGKRYRTLPRAIGPPS